MLPEELLEPWHCDSCGELMYNRDANGPCPGAPMPRFWDTDMKVCTVCYEMVLTLTGSEYWGKLHAADKEAQARKKDVWERQTGRRNYFTGI